MNQTDFKVRCWIPELKYMLYSDELSQNGNYCMYFGDDGLVVEHRTDLWWIVETIPMIALPIKDIHNKQIYESDILVYTNPKYPDHKSYIIKWNIEDCGFECINETNFMLPSVWSEMEIIGNAYENPELINDTFISIH